MAQIGRPGLSGERKAELWDRWKNGQSLSEIGNALGKHAASIFGVVARGGGIAPAARQRSRLALTMAEREEISRGIATGASIRQIALAIRRSPSTVSREIRRHGGPARYRAAEAESRAWDQARRPKHCYWLAMAYYRESWRVGCNWIGPPSKFRVGSRCTLQTMGACGCPTKQFTAVCSSKPAAS